MLIYKKHPSNKFKNSILEIAYDESKKKNRS